MPTPQAALSELANRESEGTWTLQKQTLVVGKRVEPRERSCGEDMMQIHPCSALALLGPFSLGLHGLCTNFFFKVASCAISIWLEEVEMDLKLDQWPCKTMA